MLVACGAASGIAAAYDVPIGGALFGLEVLLGSFALELLGPIVVSCVVATAVSRTLPGAHVEYVIPDYELLRPSELLLGLAPRAALRARVGDLRARDGVGRGAARPAARAGSQPALPPARARRCVGRRGDPLAAAPRQRLRHRARRAARRRARSRALAGAPRPEARSRPRSAPGAGVPGGLFTPSLFYGAALGGVARASCSRACCPGAPPPGALALVGMAAVLAGTTHAAVSSVLIIFEMTGDYGVILPLMLTAAVAAATSRAIEPDSLYTAPLRRRGVLAAGAAAPGVAAPHPGRGARRARTRRASSPTTPFEEVLKKLLALAAGARPLRHVGGRASCSGSSGSTRSRGPSRTSALLGMIVAADVVDRTVEPHHHRHDARRGGGPVRRLGPRAAPGGGRADAGSSGPSRCATCSPRVVLGTAPGRGARSPAVRVPRAPRATSWSTSRPVRSRRASAPV